MMCFFVKIKELITARCYISDGAKKRSNYMQLGGVQESEIFKIILRFFYKSNLKNN